MEIQLRASTNNIKTVDEALKFARAAARVCYSKYDFDDLLDEEDKSGLIERTLKYGHHSPFDHIKLTFYFKNLPKFGAMILNNERPYTTSEKSARYTVMELDPEMQEIYDKWMKIFDKRIKEDYPKLDDMKIKKLAQENARYFTSVFTPTKMLHTLSFRQLSYIIHFFKNFIDNADDSEFNRKVKEFMKDFNSQLDYLYEERLAPAMKKRDLSIFAKKKDPQEMFGEVYSTNFDISFAALAQAHRHRTLNFQMQPVSLEDIKFFVPPILNTEELKQEWLDDMDKVKEGFPQATLVRVNETGTFTDFLSKITERVCGHAQWEVMDVSAKQIKKYIAATEKSNPGIHAKLQDYDKGPKCTYPEIKCTEPCPFGPKEGRSRTI